MKQTDYNMEYVIDSARTCIKRCFHIRSISYYINLFIQQK